jgi:phosphopantothenoylcysteine decarboxylase / phosphopantothenate---cysteine ligase
MPGPGGRLTIVVGITGGIAAYKAVNVVRQFVLAGHDVHVVPTPAALRFVGAPTLEAISRNPVTADLYEGVAEVRHVALGQAADLIVIAPATANSLAKLAAGLADDLLGTTVPASTAPVVVAPAMHTEMWANAATRANVRVLEARGVHIVGPASGQLTGHDSGAGRMAEPADIVAAALALVPADAPTKPTPAADHLAGKRVLITAGGTREPLDPVRFVGNRSSGKQGVALAEAARDRGAMVTLIAAHLEVPEPAGVHVVHVETTEQLRAAAFEAAPEADLIVMAAAVADYRPVGTADTKLKKRDTGATFTLELVQNPDVLHDLVERRASDGPSTQLLVGFAAETEPDRDRLIALGRTKVTAKGCDFLVLNEVGWHAGFGPRDTSVIVLDGAGAIVGNAAGDKSSVAGTILDLVAPA